MLPKFAFPSHTSQGSYTLSAIVSITAGVCFVLAVANLVKYAYAVNAVQQASRSVARCLTPTDPDCCTLIKDDDRIQKEFSNISTSEWFGLFTQQIERDDIPTEFELGIGPSIYCNFENKINEVYYYTNGNTIRNARDCKIQPTCDCVCTCLIQGLGYEIETIIDNQNNKSQKFTTNCPPELGALVALQLDKQFRFSSDYAGKLTVSERAQIFYPPDANYFSDDSQTVNFNDIILDTSKITSQEEFEKLVFKNIDFSANPNAATYRYDGKEQYAGYLNNYKSEYGSQNICKRYYVTYNGAEEIPKIGDFNLQKYFIDTEKLTQNELDELLAFGSPRVYASKYSKITMDVTKRMPLGRGVLRPAECDDYEDCINESSATNEIIKMARLTGDKKLIEIAKFKGYTEIARAFPEQNINCNDTENCSNIIISQNEANAIIDVNFNLKLTFPFNIILNNYIPIKAHKEEAMELYVEML